jgi:iron complex transport system substrate-binding protein
MRRLRFGKIGILHPRVGHARRRILRLGLVVLLSVGSRDACALPPRVASINLCTDQLLLALADPGQIVGLSPYAGDPVRSWAADRARDHRLLSGTAEDVLSLKPDIVLAGRYTKRATRELLKAKNIRLVEFDPVRSLEQAKTQIARAGEIVGHGDRAAALNAALDAAVARARAVSARAPRSVLALQRRGWASGAESLMTALLAAVGLANAASALGLDAGGHVSLETIVRAHPDLLLLSRDDTLAEDQGRALILHPALQALYPPERRIVVPEALTVCGGPMLIEALDRLAAEVARVPP